MCRGSLAVLALGIRNSDFSNRLLYEKWAADAEYHGQFRNTSGQDHETSLIVPPSDPRMADSFALMIQPLVWRNEW